MHGNSRMFRSFHAIENIIFVFFSFIFFNDHRIAAHLRKTTNNAENEKGEYKTKLDSLMGSLLTHFCTKFAWYWPHGYSEQLRLLNSI